MPSWPARRPVCRRTRGRAMRWRAKEPIAMQVARRQLLAGAASVALFGAIRVAHAAKEDLQIGIPTPLTGPYADVGNQAKRAVEFAVAEANAAGGVDGRKVAVRFLDTEAKPDLARQQAEKLALSGFNILAATQTSGESLAIGPM